MITENPETGCDVFIYCIIFNGNRNFWIFRRFYSFWRLWSNYFILLHGWIILDYLIFCLKNLVTIQGIANSFDNNTGHLCRDVTNRYFSSKCWFYFIATFTNSTILRRTISESNCKPTSTAITVLRTYPEQLRLTSNWFALSDELC